MPCSRSARRLMPIRPRAERYGLAIAACLALTIPGPGHTDVPALPLKGLFCNSEDRVNDAVAHIREGWSPQAAAELANSDAVACTHVDLLHYLITGPVRLGDHRRLDPLASYRGMLTAVVVGDEVRAVSPPVEVYFITPEILIGAAVERRS